MQQKPKDSFKYVPAKCSKELEILALGLDHIRAKHGQWEAQGSLRIMHLCSNKEAERSAGNEADMEKVLPIHFQAEFWIAHT